MCLAVPGRVLEVREAGDLRSARVDFGGVVREASLAFVPEVRVGDYVLVHVGFALSKVDPEEAERTYRFLEELGQLDELQVPEAEA